MRTVASMTSRVAFCTECLAPGSGVHRRADILGGAAGLYCGYECDQVSSDNLTMSVEGHYGALLER